MCPQGRARRGANACCMQRALLRNNSTRLQGGDPRRGETGSCTCSRETCDRSCTHPAARRGPWVDVARSDPGGAQRCPEVPGSLGCGDLRSRADAAALPHAGSRMTLKRSLREQTPQASDLGPAPQSFSWIARPPQEGERESSSRVSPALPYLVQLCAEPKGKRRASLPLSILFSTDLCPPHPVSLA